MSWCGRVPPAGLRPRASISPGLKEIHGWWSRGGGHSGSDQEPPLLGRNGPPLALQAAAIPQGQTSNLVKKSKKHEAEELELRRLLIGLFPKIISQREFPPASTELSSSAFNSLVVRRSLRTTRILCPLMPSPGQKALSLGRIPNMTLAGTQIKRHKRLNRTDEVVSYVVALPREYTFDPEPWYKVR